MSYDEYQYYNYDDYEKLYLERSRKLMDLVRRWYNAKEKGNDKTMEITFQSIKKHKAKNKELKEKAKKAGFPWY